MLPQWDTLRKDETIMRIDENTTVIANNHTGRSQASGEIYVNEAAFYVSSGAAETIERKAFGKR